MKKLITLVLALVMIASLSLVASADSGEKRLTEITSTNITVNGTFTEGTVAQAIYVDITWGEMAFTFVADAPVWQPDTHTYVVENGEWEKSGNTITVTNHSNISIDAGFIFNETSSSDLTGTFTKDSVTVAAPELGALTAPSDSSDLTIDGIMEYDEATLGTVTVTISVTKDATIVEPDYTVNP